MIYARATVALPGYPAGWLGFVDETDTQIAYYLDATWMVPADGSIPPPSSPFELAGDVSGAFNDTQIQPGVVGTPELADDGVTAAKIAAGQVGQSELAAGAVTPAKVDASGGTDDQVLGIVSGAVDWIDQSGGGGGGDPTMGGDLSGTASAAQIVAGAVGASEIADGSVGSAEIASAIKDAAAATASLRTLGTGSAQAAAGNHAHALDDISDVNLSGAADGNVLGRSGGVWVPLAGGGSAFVLDDATDVAGTAAAADGLYLGKVGGVWGPVTSPGGATLLDQLNDVQAPAPADGNLLSYSTGTGQWVPVPGGLGAVTWYIFPEDYGADGATFTVAAGVSQTAGASSAGNPFTFTGQSITAPQFAANTYIVQWKVTGGIETAQLKTRIDNTHFTLAPVGNAAGTYTALNTVAGVAGVRWLATSASSGLAKDTVGWQACIDACRSSFIPIGVKPGKKYAITTSLDANGIKSFKVLGLGGRNFEGTVPDPGGAYLLGVGTTAIHAMLRCSDVATGLDNANPAPDGIIHSGAHIENLGFVDPLNRNVHGGLKTRYNTRVRIKNNHFAQLATAHRHESGAKDGSWGFWEDNSFSDNTIGIDFYNAIINGSNAPTGAMANTIKGGNIQIFQGQTGIQWWGGQYGAITDIKCDQDDPGSCLIRFKPGIAYPLHGTGLGADNTVNYAAGTSPAAGKVTVSLIRMEGTGPSMDNTSVIFEVERGAGQITFMGNHTGGGGGAGGIGYKIGVTGSGTTDHVKIIGDSMINRTLDVQFGPGAKACKAIGCFFGGNSKFAQWDTGATDCQLLDCEYDNATNPLLDSAKLDFANGTRPYIRGVTWNNGSCDAPAFNGAPSANFGFDGAHAYDSAGARSMVKIGGVWKAITVT